MKHLKRLIINESIENTITYESIMNKDYLDDCFVYFIDSHFKTKLEKTWHLKNGYNIYEYSVYIPTIRYNDLDGLSDYSNRLNTHIDEFKNSIEKLKIEYPDVFHIIGNYNGDISLKIYKRKY